MIHNKFFLNQYNTHPSVNVVLEYYNTTKENFHILNPIKDHHLKWATGKNTCRYLSRYEEANSNTGPDDEWDYHLNHFLFRDEWQLLPSTKKIGFFGCSVTFGIGLPSHQTFAKLVESRYSPKIESLNFATPGASIIRISNILREAIKNFHLDCVVITLPTMERFHLFLNNSPVDVMPTFAPVGLEDRSKHIYKALNQNDLTFISANYIESMTYLLDKSNIPALWGSWDERTLFLLQNIIPRSHVLPLIPHSEDFGFARDNGHPGPNAVAPYADAIVNKINSLNLLQLDTGTKL